MPIMPDALNSIKRTVDTTVDKVGQFIANDTTLKLHQEVMANKINYLFKGFLEANVILNRPALHGHNYTTIRVKVKTDGLTEDQVRVAEKEVREIIGEVKDVEFYTGGRNNAFTFGGDGRYKNNPTEYGVKTFEEASYRAINDTSKVIGVLFDKADDIRAAVVSAKTNSIPPVELTGKTTSPLDQQVAVNSPSQSNGRGV